METEQFTPRYVLLTEVKTSIDGPKVRNENTGWYYVDCLKCGCSMRQEYKSRHAERCV